LDLILNRGLLLGVRRAAGEGKNHRQDQSAYQRPFAIPRDR
jgi:hypothetical protein